MSAKMPSSRRVLTLIVVALVVGMGLLAAPPAQAGTWTVMNNADSGPGSLRQMILDAGSGDTINFSGDYTITLSSQLVIDKNLTIDGSGHSIVVSGGGGTRVVSVTIGTNVSMRNLAIKAGYPQETNPMGGGIFNSGALTLMDCRLEQNVAMAGGGIANTGTLTATNCSFIGNGAQGGNMGAAGGGILNTGTATISKSQISGNAAHAFSPSAFGGGIANTGALTVSNSSIIGNDAADLQSAGGGIANKGTLTVINSTFSDNEAPWRGGAIDNWGTVMIMNTVIADSLSPNNCSGNAFAAGSTHNLTDDASCSGGFTQSSSILLGTAGDYGGGTLTVPLLPDSAAIDAGDPSCPAQDQRGLPRVGVCDIGAFESQGFTLSITGGNNQSTFINTAFADSLQLGVTALNSVEPVNGGRLTFTAPASGASAALATNPITITAGAASVTAAANGTAGSYQVAANAAGGNQVTFNLSNVFRSSTSTNVTSSANPATIGETIIFTATASSAGSGTPGGTILFKADGATLGSAVSLSGGSASISTASLALGSHIITAEYSGDADFAPSTGTLTPDQVVNEAAPGSAHTLFMPLVLR